MHASFALQKRNAFSTLGDVLISLKTGPITLSNLAMMPDVNFPSELMNLEAKVCAFHAVVTQNKKLLTVGSTVRIQSESSVSIQYNTCAKY